MFIIVLIIFEYLDQVYRKTKKLYLTKTKINFLYFLGLAWIELHVLNPTNRLSPISTEDLSDELTIESLIDLIHIIERKPSSSSTNIPNGDS